MAGYDNKARRPFLRPAACLRLDSEQRKGQQAMASGTVSSTVFRMPEDGIPSLDGEDVAVFVGVCPNEDLPFFEKQIVDKAVSTIVVLFDPTDELGGAKRRNLSRPFRSFRCRGFRSNVDFISAIWRTGIGAAKASGATGLPFPSFMQTSVCPSRKTSVRRQFRKTIRSSASMTIFRMCGMTCGGLFVRLRPPRSTVCGRPPC